MGLTRSELSTGFPRPLPMPQEQRKIAQVMAAPIRMASTLPISGKVVILQRKYTELEMMEAETISSPIYKPLASLNTKIHMVRSLPSSYHRAHG